MRHVSIFRLWFIKKPRSINISNLPLEIDLICLPMELFPISMHLYFPSLPTEILDKHTEQQCATSLRQYNIGYLQTVRKCPSHNCAHLTSNTTATKIQVSPRSSNSSRNDFDSPVDILQKAVVGESDDFYSVDETWIFADRAHCGQRVRARTPFSWPSDRIACGSGDHWSASGPNNCQANRTLVSAAAEVIYEV